MLIILQFTACSIRIINKLFVHCSTYHSYANSIIIISLDFMMMRTINTSLSIIYYFISNKKCVRNKADSRYRNIRNSSKNKNSRF